MATCLTCFSRLVQFLFNTVLAVDFVEPVQIVRVLGRSYGDADFTVFSLNKFLSKR